MSVLATVVAWIVALALCGAVLLGVGVTVREPIRAWRAGDRRHATLLALAVFAGLFVMWAASRVVP